MTLSIFVVITAFIAILFCLVNAFASGGMWGLLWLALLYVNAYILSKHLAILIGG